MKTAFLFGGSGFIGQHLLHRFLELDLFNAYVIYDLRPPNDPCDLPDKVKFISCDVRQPIPEYDGPVDHKASWIFNLAAVHREPGHQPQEYFQTNVSGSRHINDFANQTGVTQLFFTSSIAPYGRSLGVSTEASTLNPETPYGFSKKEAENLHQVWNASQSNRRLIIVRPSVIYGPKDRGNIYRMIKALKKGSFLLPDGGKVIKAYGYVHGLADSVLFTMGQSDKEIIYNYAEHPLLNLKQLTQVVKKEFRLNKPVLSLPVRLLTTIAQAIHKSNRILGLESDIHPVRVRKAAFPTNIKPQYLIDHGFVFRFGFENSLRHWQANSPEDFI